MNTPLPITRNLTRAYALSLVVALLLAGSSLAGLIFQGRLYPTEELRRSFVANDVVNLFIGLPILLGAMRLTRRGRLIGLLFWPGALLYVIYNYVAYAVASWMVPGGPAPGQLHLPGVAETPQGKKGGGISIDLVPAPGIPVTTPDLVGTLVDQKDNSLFVRAQTKGGDAPVTEVVVAGSTRLYRNATGDHLTTPPPQGAKIPMVVEAWAVAQINPGDSVIVWGQRRGERIVAEVILVALAAHQGP